MSVAYDHGVLAVVPDSASEPFAAFAADDQTFAAAIGLAARRGWPKGEVQRGGLSAALRQLGVVPPAEVTVVDIGEVADPAAAADGLRELAQGTRLIVLGVRDDIATFRMVLDAGAADYLPKPVDPETLDEAVARAASRAQSAAAASAPVRLGRCIAFVGARGGVGTSTLAANVSWLIAEERARNVCAVDLDLQFGTLAVAFDVEPSPGLREALEDPERVDDFFVERSEQKIGEHFAVLAAEEPLDDAPRFGSQAVAHLLHTLRQRYDLIVVDLPRGVLATQSEMLQELSDVVVVSDLSLASLRDANRLERFLRQAGPGKLQHHIVANASGQPGRGEIRVAEFRKELDGTLTRELSADGEALAQAALAARPLSEVAKRSRLLRDLRALTNDLIGEPRRKKRSLSTLLQALKR